MAREKLLTERAKRHSLEVEVEVRQWALFERKVLFVLAIVTYAGALVAELLGIHLVAATSGAAGTTSMIAHAVKQRGARRARDP